MKYFLVFFATIKPMKKKIITDKVVPLPLPKKEPKYINMKIILEDKIFKWIPIIEPIIKKNIIDNVLPNPIPKYEPTKPI